MSRMPDAYRGELGWPLRWQDEVTGELPDAVLAFFEGARSLTPAQFELVREYCRYYIDAPVWDSNPYHDDETRATLVHLRMAIRKVRTASALNAWIHQCLDKGIDPL